MMTCVVIAALFVTAASTTSEADYQRDGVTFPLKVFEVAEHARYLAHFNHIETEQPGSATPS
jgi:hypothetical protein